METYFDSIPPGREGWVYLLHAEGTNRYKIGRSVNPITRCADIQKQSPYPLRIIKTRWTLDAIADEANLHRITAQYRVFGEWFELTPECGERGNRKVAKLKEDLDYLFTMHRIRDETIDLFHRHFHLDPNCTFTSKEIFDLYVSITNRQDVLLAENFVRKTLVALVGQRYLPQGDLPTEEGFLLEVVDRFICGAIASFGFILLNKNT